MEQRRRYVTGVDRGCCGRARRGVARALDGAPRRRDGIGAERIGDPRPATSSSIRPGWPAIRGARATSPSSPPSICSARERQPTTATWSGPKRTRDTRSRFGPAGTSGAFGVLASSLLSQHRFAEALDVSPGSGRGGLHFGRGARPARPRPLRAGALRRGRPRCSALSPRTRAISVSRRDWRAGPSCTGSPRKRVACLRAGARDEADRRHGMPQEQLAWFHLRLGDLALRYGHLGEAKDELEAGLAIAPGDCRLLAASGTTRMLSAATGARRRTMASRPSHAPSIPRRSVCFTTRTPRWATRRRRTSTTAPWRCRSCGSPAPFIAHGVSSSSTTVARSRGAGQGGGRASHAQRHLRL